MVANENHHDNVSSNGISLVVCAGDRRLRELNRTETGYERTERRQLSVGADQDSRVGYPAQRGILSPDAGFRAGVRGGGVRLGAVQGGRVAAGAVQAGDGR